MNSLTDQQRWDMDQFGLTDETEQNSLWAWCNTADVFYVFGKNPPEILKAMLSACEMGRHTIAEIDSRVAKALERERGEK